MLAASIMTATTLIATFVVNRIKNYQAQKAQTKAKESLHQAEKIEGKSTSLGIVSRIYYC